MSLITSEYNEEMRIDKCFYNSSNVLYSECDDKLNEFKDIKITFSDGRNYLYEGVNVVDYLLFKNSISQGKDLFKYIAVKKSGVDKHKTTRLENTDLIYLESEKRRILENIRIKQIELLKEQENAK
jgi:hypothetical protein